MPILPSQTPYYGGKQSRNPLTIYDGTVDPSSNDKDVNLGDEYFNKTSSKWFKVSGFSSGTIWDPLQTGSSSFPITPYVVGPNGGFATIQSAIDAASAAGIDATVYVQPGTYTENLTLVDGIHIAGTIDENTTIVGVHTPPAAGNFTFQNLTLQSATHIFSSAVAGTASLVVEMCIVSITSGYLFNLANWTGTLAVFDSDSSTGNDGFVNNTGGASVIANSTNLGKGTSNPFIISGTVNLRDVELRCPGTFQGSSEVDIASSVLLGTITTAGSVALLMANCVLQPATGTAAISHGSSGIMDIDMTDINTSASNCIAGTGVGVIDIGNVSFNDSSGIASTLTITYSRSVGRISPFSVGTSGNFSTIQDAITAAAAAGGGVVYIQDGTYTENLILNGTVSLIGNDNANVIISGAHTLPASGTTQIQIRNIKFESATNIFASAVAGQTDILLYDCLFNCINGQIISAANWTGEVFIVNCVSIGTDDGGFTLTGSSNVFIFNSVIGAGTLNSASYSGGSLIFENSTLNVPVSFGTSAIVIIDRSSSFYGTITTANDSQVLLTNSYINTGAAAAISHGSSGTFELVSCYVDSSNNPAIDGAGAGIFFSGDISFANNSSYAGTLTTQFIPLTVGGIVVNNQISIQSGTVTDFAGAFTLTAGVQTIANTNISANDQIYLQRQSINGSSALGLLTYAITPSTSFTITSVQAGTPAATETNDVSIGEYLIVRRF